MNVSSGLYKTLRIAAIHEEVPDFKTIVFEDAPTVRYQAGQYLTFVRFENGAELRRSYSITAAPVLHESLSIGVKRVPNGAFSRYLVDHARIGDELITIGSGGFFVLPPDIALYRQLFFFAAGSGITPVYSLLKTALYAHTHLDVVLVYSNASISKAAFLPALQALEKHYAGRFHVELLFSDTADLARARLNRDLLLLLLHQYLRAEKKATLFYSCGPESYMRLCTYTLQAMGVPPENIKKENFFFANVARRDAAPPDKHDHHAIVTVAGKEYRFMVSYPDSILQAAKRQGLALPYSCEAGRCGSCVAYCIKGKVWHSYNEILTDRELAQGLVLTCVGHPNGGDVHLKIE